MLINRPPKRLPSPIRLAHGETYDAVTVSNLPTGAYVAVYANGRYRANPAELKRFKNVTWIDVNGTDPRANALDIETGDATPETVLSWVPDHVKIYGAKAHSRLYSNLSTWPAVKAAVARLAPAERSTVMYWVANPTGVRHLVPGSAATQWFWGPGYDITYWAQNFS